MAKAIGYMKPDIDPNTRLYVPFNEGVGNVAKDYSQYCNHAQLTDVEWSPDGFNGAGRFNGSSSLGDCGAGASLNIPDAITIQAWVKLANIAATQKYIVRKRSAWNSVYGYSFFVYGTLLYFEHGDGLTYNQVAKDVGATTDSNHLMITHASNITKWYRNGNYVDEDTNIGLVSDSTNLHISHSSASFLGTIDEVRIYALVLSAAQNAADCYEVVCS